MMPFFNTLTDINNEQYICYNIYSSLLTLVDTNKMLVRDCLGPSNNINVYNFSF